jgi:hypothetical protein
MMKREVFLPNGSTENQLLLPFHHDSDEDKLEIDDGKHCYPLCERRFKKDDVLRRIYPCGHVFHEKCL